MEIFGVSLSPDLNQALSFNPEHVARPSTVSVCGDDSGAASRDTGEPYSDHLFNGVRLVGR